MPGFIFVSKLLRKYRKHKRMHIHVSLEENIKWPFLTHAVKQERDFPYPPASAICDRQALRSVVLNKDSANFLI